MPYRERRNSAVTLTCQYCGRPFHPYKPEEATARYCSCACGTVSGRERMAALRAAGTDPAHGGAVAQKRRAALARRRSEGEHFGRIPRGAPAPDESALPPPT